MENSNRKVEILAPAGSVEQLVAAVNNGCDSVYLGVEFFNARMKAPNFTLDNVGSWIDYCHLYAVKVYIALNTSIKNNEFAEAAELLFKLYKLNADGVIITDLALLQIAGLLPKPFDVVASTQLNAHDEFGAAFLKKLGATTVVCARESSLDEIKSIVSAGVTTECFIHGATCVCQSGQCLFSSMVGGNSGNRGLCAQPCRKLYTTNVSKDSLYLLSAKDLCGLDSAKSLYDAGVGVYKIEGRNRRAEYAAVTSNVYNKLFANNFSYTDDDKTQMAECYNRSMSNLSYLNANNGEIIYPYAQNHVGVRVGVIKNGVIYAEKEIAKGDGLKILDGKREYCGGVATDSGLGLIRAEFDKKVRDGMEVRRTSSVKLSQNLLSKQKKLPIRIKFAAHHGNNAVISAQYDSVVVEVQSDFIVQNALSKPTTREEIVAQLQKVGDSPFAVSDIVIDVDNVFIAKSQLNAMRRAVLEQLTSAIILAYNSTLSNRSSVDLQTVLSQVGEILTTSSMSQPLENSLNALAVLCYTIDQLKQAKNFAKYRIFKPHVVNSTILNEVKDVDCFIDLPSFSDNNYLYDLFQEYKFGVVCHNVGHVELARRLSLPYIAGSGLNIYNDNIAQIFDDSETFVYSIELTLREISQFADKNGLIFVDGKIPLMKLVHCPYKVAYKCSCATCAADKPLIYTDELGNKFDVYRRRDARCSFELLNGKKLSVVGKLQYGGRFLIDYDERVIEHYDNLNKGIVEAYVETSPYTKGRLYSKVN